MNELPQEQFHDWAICELFGHQREIGFVTTRYFGTACLFQVDVPELPERDYILDEPQWIGGEVLDVGAKVRKKAVPARSRLLGPGAIYALNPCTKEAAFLAMEKSTAREIVKLEAPAPAKKRRALPAETSA